MAEASGIATPSAAALKQPERQRKGQRLSHAAWARPADPAARLTRMPDGRARLAYQPAHAVDRDPAALVATEIHPADRADSATLDDTLAAAARGLAAAGGAPTIASPAALIFPGQDEINLSASAGRLHGNRNLGERRPVQQQIERKGGAEQRRQVAIGATGKQAHLRPRSVDHPGGSEAVRAVGDAIARLDAGALAVLDDDALDLHVVERGRSTAARPAQKLHEDALGTQHHGIKPERPATQTPLSDLREELQDFTSAQDPAARQADPGLETPMAVKTEQIVGGERQAQETGTLPALAMERHQARQGPHQVGN